MSMYDLPGGPSQFSVRNDLGNVKKIQREARDISEASGGPYRQRKENKELSQGASTKVEQPTMAPGNPLASALGPINLLEPGNPDVALSDGAKGGPGRDNSAIIPPVDDFNQGEILARAMYLANPTPQLARIVDAYNQEKRG
jgi:hypothetical protein